jgi:hypothetical protein
MTMCKLWNLLNKRKTGIFFDLPQAKEGGIQIHLANREYSPFSWNVVFMEVVLRLHDCYNSAQYVLHEDVNEIMHRKRAKLGILTT